MAITNHERVGDAMDLLKQGLFPFVEREFKDVCKERTRAQAGRLMGEDHLLAVFRDADTGGGETLTKRLGEIEIEVNHLSMERGEVGDRLWALTGEQRQVERVTPLLSGFGTMWRALVPQEQRELLHLLIDCVVVNLAAGEFADDADLVQARGVTRARISQIMALLLRAPDMQEEMLYLEVAAGAQLISKRPVGETVCSMPLWVESRTVFRSLNLSGCTECAVAYCARGGPTSSHVQWRSAPTRARRRRSRQSQSRSM